MQNIFKTFFKYTLRYRITFTVFIIVGLLASTFSNLQNFFYKFFVENLNSGSLNKLFLIILGFVALKLLHVTFNNIMVRLGDTFGLKASRDLRMDIFKHLHALDFAYHEEKHSGSLIGIIKRGDQAFFNMYEQIFFNLFRILVDFGFIIFALGSLRIEIALLIILVFLLNLVATRFLIKTNITARIRFNDVEDEISGVIIDNLINYDTVKFFAKEKYEEKRVKESYVEWLKRFMGYSDTFRYIDFGTGLLSAFGILGVLSYSLYLFINNEMSGGDLVLVISFVTAFFPKLTDFVYRFREIAKAYIDIEKYIGVLSVPIEVKDPENPKHFEDIQGNVELKNVSFNYKGRKSIIENFDLDVKAGESIALVGRSGAGKTTITKLLMRFYDIAQGEITIDGINIKDVTKEELRKNIGIVPQEAILFNDTIGYNIGYALEGKDLDKIKEAAKLAHLDSFIESLPEKYNTVVGERGIKLSGGQKQRLAIARMILENPQIIIFDEATSHLDSESEKYIQDAFWDFAKDKTTIIIAHRFSTIMKADRIVVMEKGKIIEEGTHDELAGKGEVYQKLWDLQVNGVIQE